MISSLNKAFQILDTQKYDIPYETIEFLQNQPDSEELTSKIIYSFMHAYDGTYTDNNDEFQYSTPLWYAIVAETHLSKELVLPVIGLFTSEEDDWDMLNEQGQYLIGKLAELYPDLVMTNVVKEVDMLMALKSGSPYLYLFDAFYFADIEKYKKWYLEKLADKNLTWEAPFAETIADLQIKEAAPDRYPIY